MTAFSPAPARFAALCAGLILIALSILLTQARADHRSELTPRACFPAKQWGPAPDRDRPCVFRIYEDGSVLVRQRDGGRVLADD